LYLPAVIRYTADLAKAIGLLEEADASSKVQQGILENVSSLLESANKKLGVLEAALSKAQGTSDAKKKAESYRDAVMPAMTNLRADIDALEGLVPAKLWPVPTYAEMLFNL
jgi:glutamine synthetase